jgi:hypothetical protein
MKNYLMLLILNSSGLFAGTGMGGGTPPAREQLKNQLMSAEFASAGLFDNELGDVGLLTNRELQPQLTLSRSRFSASDIKISEADFEMLRDRQTPIDSIGALGERRSFKVSAGDRLDSLNLIDRRAAARAAVAQ